MWLKKAQQVTTQVEIEFVKRILETNNDPETIRQELQKVGNPCAALDIVCNSGQIVPASYVDIWQQICGGSEIGKETQTETQDQA